ncbi:amidohydrolase family protein [Gudongella sp. SC589]|uniref:amidohydrolase family protein n=1 Tax=Gudongella sp. SC589 TaxID=3385990 RepID=UPI003904C51E
MNRVDMVVVSEHLYTMTGEGVGYLEDGAMAIDRGRIVAVGKKDEILETYDGEKTLQLEKKAVFPGLIDAHMHTGFGIMRGLAQDTGNWMMYGLQPFDNVLTDNERNEGSKLGIIEAVKAGTTTLGDYETNMEFVAGFINKLGARGNLTYMIREAEKRVYKPGELYQFNRDLGEQGLLKNLELYDKWHNRDSGRIRVLFGPQGPDFVGRELLEKIYGMAERRDTLVHMHTQQGDRETYQVQKRYGKRPIEWLKEEGFLNERLIAVHLTDARDDEAKVVAQSGAGMILCPGSIGIIDGIVPPSVAFQAAGGNVALGSDQAPGNNCHNIINEMKLVALFNKIKYSDPEVMPAWRALRMATIEGARAIGLGDLVGSLEVGKRADFIAIDLKKPSMSPVYSYPMRNMVPNLVYSARGDEVCLSVVDGEVIYQDGKLVNVDEGEILAEVDEYPDSIGKRASGEFFGINGTNAVFMREGKL